MFDKSQLTERQTEAVIWTDGMTPGFTTACPACGRTNRTGRRYCAECGGSPTPPPRPDAATAKQPEGERRQLTVMFCDLVGSTELAGRMDPEDWRATVERYQHAARD